MKKQLLILVLIASSQFARAQSTTYQFHYSKVWNYVKYYHPAIASGKVNADSIFFKYLPLANNVNTDKEFNQFVTGFLNSLLTGHLPVSPGTDTGKKLTNNLDFNWYKSNVLFSKANQSKLAYIFRHRYRNPHHHYIPDVNYESLIPNEPPYPYADSVNIPYPMRMLAIAKLQGAVDYLFPHKYLADNNIDSVILRLLPFMVSCQTRQEYERIILNIVSAFNDTHSFRLISSMKFRKRLLQHYFYPPFSYAVLKNSIVVTGIADSAICERYNIRKGDEITMINSTPVAGHIARLSLLLSASNKPTLLFRLSSYVDNYIWKSESRNVSLLINGKEQQIPFLDPTNQDDKARILAYVGGSRTKEKTGKQVDILAGNIAYINIHETERFYEGIEDSLIDATVDSLLSVVKAQKGIIFDMRGYPDWGGFVYTYMLQKFGKTPNRFADYYEVNKNEVGTFVIEDDIAVYHNAEITADNEPYTGKVVIIVNPATLSQSEWNTMSLQHIFPNSITIGEQSAGADGDEKALNIPGGYVVPFTGNAVFYPNGEAAQRKGVRIDRKIPLTKEMVLSDKDELLEAAIRIMGE